MRDVGRGIVGRFGAHFPVQGSEPNKRVWPVREGDVKDESNGDEEANEKGDSGDEHEHVTWLLRVDEERRRFQKILSWTHLAFLFR